MCRNIILILCDAIVVPYRGMSPAAAELMYIKLAQQLPEYGHEIYQALVCAPDSPFSLALS